MVSFRKLAVVVALCYLGYRYNFEKKLFVKGGQNRYVSCDGIFRFGINTVRAMD